MGLRNRSRSRPFINQPVPQLVVVLAVVAHRLRCYPSWHLQFLALKKYWPAKQLLQREDHSFAQFVREREEAELKKSYQKQGELLASVHGKKFDLTIAASSTSQKPADVQEPGPEDQGQPVQTLFFLQRS